MDRQLTQRGEERRQQLMAFATARFAENGFHPTSVAEITEGLGVGKGVFYWYFESKEDLLRAILADAQRDLRRRQRVAIAELDDPAARIEAGIRASMRWSIDHPAVFPVALPEFVIEAYSDEGDIVFEPFGGSGTTMLAAERIGRICRSVEIAPVYVDVAIKRFQQNHPGVPVTLIATGQSFEQVAAERATTLDAEVMA